MNKNKLYIIIAIAFFSVSLLKGQTASVTSGCAELKVDFTAPQAATYFWNFGDGSFSDLRNPTHSYVQAGDFIVKLFDVENGTQVGSDIKITVYPEIEINIAADVRTGCAPLSVEFSSTINAHPDIVIKDIIWTFGDGESASGNRTSYTYKRSGTFTVSIKVITENDIKCDEPIIFENYILAEGPRTSFRIDRNLACDTPADFIFTNTTRDSEDFTFSWDFGNGQTSTEEGPLRITYNTTGLIPITLTSTTAAGCSTSSTKFINVGSPVINTDFPDTICAGNFQLLSNTTIADSFFWDFRGTDLVGDDLIIHDKSPVIKFKESGIKTFTLTAKAEDGCETTETYTTYVNSLDSEYELGPEITCQKDVEIQFTANNPTYETYEFTTDVTDPNTKNTYDTPTGTGTYTHIDRDPYYINYKDSIITRLVVTSAQGCTDTTLKFFYLQRPEAFFIPDVVKGCVPFDVNFTDLSFSVADITSRTWNFGDGSVQTFGAEDTAIVHTYERSGFHTVELNITNEAGCMDLSREVLIVAISKDTLEAEGGGRCMPRDGQPLNICVGDTFEMVATSNQVTTNIHIEGDEGRLDHCWNSPVSSHIFNNPGTYPLSFTLEFLDIYIDSFSTPYIVNVMGSKSDLDYKIDCSDPYVVDFNSEKSLNADRVAWYINDEHISDERALTHTFIETGDYMIFLESFHDASGCAHIDSALIHITDIKAEINVPDKICANSPILLDASPSIDVHSTCVSGYKWEFESHRPREVSSDSLFHVFPPGDQTITLTVEDINGCTDTATASFKAYEVISDFDIADTIICLPLEVQLTDLSRGDTTVVGWSWDFGEGLSEDRNPAYTFREEDYHAEFAGDSILVILEVEDALGCTNEYERIITTYDIISEVTLDNGPTICQDEEIGFFAADYVQDGSFLNFSWDFENIGVIEGQNPSIVFPESGEVNVLLTYTEEATGCMGTIDTSVIVKQIPDAEFTTPFDNLNFICFPEQLDFTSETGLDEDVLYRWNFGNGAESTLEDPVIPFDKGTYEVTMIARSFFGCADTFSRSYTLVGPEGEFVLDKDEICPGEPITLTLINPVDVDSYTWDLGDGNQVHDQSPVTHTYEPQSSVTTFNPTLILRSDDNGCEHIQDLPINLSSATADFIDSSGVCPGEVTLFSDFVNPQSIRWEIDGQVVENTSNPSVSIDSNSDSVSVILMVTDNLGCEIERRKNIANPEAGNDVYQFPNVFSPNGDSRNPNFNVVIDPTKITGEVRVVNFKVYDRWGELLYDNENPANGWNGAYKGDIVPPDVYAYFIELSVEGCSNKSKKGNVTVIK